MSARSNPKDSSTAPSNTTIAAPMTNPTITNYYSHVSSDAGNTQPNDPPFTVTRTASSSSVSASTHVQIETPISRFSLRQGTDYDQPVLPAPHLRPSLLKLAAARAVAARKRNVRSAGPPRPLSSARASYPSDRLKAYNAFRLVFFKPLYRGGRIIDGPTTVTRNDIQTPDLCRGLEHHALLSAPDSDCREFLMCIATKDQKYIIRKFRCVQDGFTFDYTTGKCSSTTKGCIKSRMSLKNKQVTDPLQVCSLMSKGAFVLDPLSDCHQYFQCPVFPQTVIATRQCPDGYIFSQHDGICIPTNEVSCEASTNDLFRYLSIMDQFVLRDYVLKDAKLKYRNSNLLRRMKRNSLMQINPKEISRGAMTKLASIVDGPLVPRNNVDGTEKLFPIFEHGSEKKFNKDITKTNKDLSTSKNESHDQKNDTEQQPYKNGIKIFFVIPKVVHTGNGKRNDLTNEELQSGMESNDSESLEINRTMEESTLSKQELTTDVVATEAMFTTEIFEAITEITPEIEETTMLPEETTTVLDTTTETTVATTSVTSFTTSPASTMMQIQSTESTKTTLKEPHASAIPDQIESFTNFSCKDKVLEQFYPDITDDCRIFHYCTPGFTVDEVFDLTFECSGDTGFDVITKRCESISTANCGNGYQSSIVIKSQQMPTENDVASDSFIVLSDQVNETDFNTTEEELSTTGSTQLWGMEGGSSPESAITSPSSELPTTTRGKLPTTAKGLSETDKIS